MEAAESWCEGTLGAVRDMWRSCSKVIRSRCYIHRHLLTRSLTGWIVPLTGLWARHELSPCHHLSHGEGRVSSSEKCLDGR